MPRAVREFTTVVVLVLTLLLALLLPGASPALAQQGGPPIDPTVTTRVDGSTPTEVAIALSRQLHQSDGARHVALARDDEFADALAASPLTAEGPLLFTDSAALDDDTAAEIVRVLPAGGTVYLLGGSDALSPAVEDVLVAEGYLVRRLAGPTRVQTALRVADEVHELYPVARGIVVLARADAPTGNPTAAWADAITGGSWAASRGLPVVLTPGDRLHDDVRGWMISEEVHITVLLGGQAALTDGVREAVPQRTERIFGPDRAGTAAMIARLQWGAVGAAPRHFILVDGYRTDGWAHGLAAAGLAARMEVPMLLVGGGGDGVPPATRQLTTECGEPQVQLTLVGDESVIGPTTAAALDVLDGQACTAEAATAAAIEQQIREDFAHAIPMGAACEPPVAVVRGAEMPCRLDTFDDGSYDDFALVLWTSDDGRYRYDFGTGILRNGQDAIRSLGSGRTCADLASAGEPYFPVVLYWFADGEPERMDPDADGRPCEGSYDAETVEAFWS